MSRMSQLHAELTQEAYENGYDNLADYLADKERNEAHEAWLEEKETLLEDLKEAKKPCRNIKFPWSQNAADVMERAIEFIKKGDM